jgi:hypothetical protein
MHGMTSDLLTRIELLEVELGRLKTLAAQSAADTPSLTQRDEHAPVEQSTSRRDLLRYGAVALGAAATAGMSASRVEAADGGPVVIGASNAATNATIVSATNGYGLYGTTMQLPDGCPTAAAGEQELDGEASSMVWSDRRRRGRSCLGRRVM